MTIAEELVEQPEPVAAPARRSRRSRLFGDAPGFAQLRFARYGIAPLLFVMLIAVFQNFDGELFLNAGPDIIKKTGININAIITIVYFSGFVALFIGLGIGWYGDRHRRLPIYGIGTILSGLGAMASGFGTTFTRLALARVADDGFGVAGNTPNYSLVSDWYPPETRGRAFSVLAGAVNLAGLAALPLGGLMILRLGLRTTFLICGAPLIVLGIGALIFLREPIRGYHERRELGLEEPLAEIEDEPQSFGEAWRATFAVRTVRRFFFANMVSELAAVLELFLIYLLSSRYGLDAFHRGLVLALPISFNVLGLYLGGRLLDNFSRRNPARVLTLYGAFGGLVAVSLGVIALQPPIAVLIAVLAVRYFGRALVGPAGFAVYSQVIPPSIRTQGLQATSLSAVPAYLFGVPIFSAIFAKYGFSTAFGWGVPFVAVGAIVAASAGRFFEVDRRNAKALALANNEWRQAKAEGRGKLLVCRDVDVAYEGVQVLFGVDFDVDEGEIIALLGTNGAGKSTLLRAISGLQEANAGAVVFDGRDITHMPTHEIAARQIILMPGGRGLFPGLTVRENLLLGTWLTEDEDAVRGALAEVSEIFPTLAGLLDLAAGALSGGQQQQVSLAQAFLARPRLLMIDELSLGLSPIVVQELLEAVRRIRARGVTVIVVEQSVNVALALAERAIFMEKGEVKFVGATADLLARPDILRAVYVKGTGALTEGVPAAARSRGEFGPSAAPALEVSGIVKRFGGVTALDGVDLVLAEGDVLGLIGPNGSGKTTLFDIISGHQVADEGTIFYEGVDVSRLSPDERARRHLVRRFQDARLFPSLTVFETLLVALDQRLEVRNAFLSAASWPQARRAERRLQARADKLIELLDLGAYRDKFIKELSTGLRRIVDLACVLATEPKVLLLDEPSSGIAQAEAEGLGPLLRRVRFETGCSMLIIEHDMPLISAVSSELVALDLGQVLIRGTPEVVLENERVIEAYLGGSEAAVRRSGSLA